MLINCVFRFYLSCFIFRFTLFALFIFFFLLGPRPVTYLGPTTGQLKAQGQMPLFPFAIGPAPLWGCLPCDVFLLCNTSIPRDSACFTHSSLQRLRLTPAGAPPIACHNRTYASMTSMVGPRTQQGLVQPYTMQTLLLCIATMHVKHQVTRPSASIGI